MEQPSASTHASEYGGTVTLGVIREWSLVAGSLARPSKVATDHPSPFPIACKITNFSLHLSLIQSIS